MEAAEEGRDCWGSVKFSNSLYNDEDLTNSLEKSAYRRRRPNRFALGRANHDAVKGPAREISCPLDGTVVFAMGLEAGSNTSQAQKDMVARCELDSSDIGDEGRD